MRQRTARDLSSVDRGQKSGPHLIVPQLDDSLVKRPTVYERRSPEGVPTGDRAVSDRLEEKSVSRLTVCRSRSAPGSNSKAGQHESRGLRQPGGLSPGVRHLFAGRKVKPETKVGPRFEAPTGEESTYIRGRSTKQAPLVALSSGARWKG